MTDDKLTDYYKYNIHKLVGVDRGQNKDANNDIETRLWKWNTR